MATWRTQTAKESLSYLPEGPQPRIRPRWHERELAEEQETAFSALQIRSHSVQVGAARFFR